jgi:hypothetical protein
VQIKEKMTRFPKITSGKHREAKKAKPHVREACSSISGLLKRALKG